MRVLVVGSAAERAALRNRIDGTIDIAGEFATLAAARASDVAADAILLASPTHDGDDDEEALNEPLTPRGGAGGGTTRGRTAEQGESPRGSASAIKL
jgi:hypothetical protein